MKKDLREYKIAAIYDTETCNLCIDEAKNEWRAYPVLFIVNDVRGCDLRKYVAGAGEISFFRRESEMLDCIDSYIEAGSGAGYVPVICAYNLMFDLQPLMYALNKRHDLRVSAQSATSAYTLDVLGADGKTALRFWDTFYLEMRGLSKMGEVCGLPKAVGAWDYSLVRTPETPLTEAELFYAGRDTEVIPCYLRYLLESNEWLTPDMLGTRVLTKTSLVRQAGRLETGRLRVKRGNGRKISVQKMMETLCADNLAPTYEQYGARKACFRGGFTFTSARYAGLVQSNVYSIDEVSAHHAYINGHMLPVNFHVAERDELQAMCDSVLRVGLGGALRHWDEPFGCAFHARLRFKNLRLKRGSAFDEWGIALLSEAKFKMRGQLGDFGGENDREGITAVRSAGFVDVSYNGRFAFGKLVSADWAIVNVSELELWCMSRVYAWDALEALGGEGTCSFVKPPDYVTLLSNLFYERKNACKVILKTYKTGNPYKLGVPDSIPSGIADRIRTGAMLREDLEAYYNSTVKGMFNSIYGMEAQDVFKPGFRVDDGEVSVDRDTVVSRETYEEQYDARRKKLVLYPYGLRIVGGSRCALVAAIELVHRAFGDRVRVLGGDTDSLKISCDRDVTGDDLMRALAPFHEAVTSAIDLCQSRVREVFPDYASDLAGVGTFEVEGAPYELHMDAWNKARVSWDGEHAHITCAGLSRPSGTYTIEHWVDDMSARHGFAEVAPRVLGWGVRVCNSVSHALEHRKPAAADVFGADVTDYLGKTARVRCHESIALYPSDRVLGDADKPGNARTIAYLHEVYGREVDTTERIIDNVSGKPVYLYIDESGEVREW